MNPSVVIFSLLMLEAVATAFHAPPAQFHKFCAASSAAAKARHLELPPLLAKKENKKKAARGSGGGFGASSSSKPSAKDSSSSSGGGVVGTISADKTSLEKQWDAFASITYLEISPTGDADDDDYRHFEVVDVFVRCGETESNRGGGTGWFRIGKVCAADGTTAAAALTLQKGLIFWTAVHMRRELVAAGGRKGASALELGFVTPGSLCVGSESDAQLDEEEAEAVHLSEKVSVRGVPARSFGFRPDWNPPGFTYKRRERAAMKKKRSALDEIAAAS